MKLESILTSSKIYKVSQIGTPVYHLSKEERGNFICIVNWEFKGEIGMKKAIYSKEHKYLVCKLKEARKYPSDTLTILRLSKGRHQALGVPV